MGTNPPSPVEPGQSTSEFGALIGAVVANLLALVVDFGVKLTAAQQTDILALQGSITALATAYIIGRSVRKVGS